MSYLHFLNILIQLRRLEVTDMDLIVMHINTCILDFEGEKALKLCWMYSNAIWTIYIRKYLLTISRQTNKNTLLTLIGPKTIVPESPPQLVYQNKGVKSLFLSEKLLIEHIYKHNKYVNLFCHDYWYFQWCWFQKIKQISWIQPTIL